jgi:PAS domain S-box-containing protein
MKVLIVDDNDQSLYVLRTVLEKAGHEVWPAADGAEALALAGRQIPDAVITDILMPRLDGFALCRALRQSEKLGDVPVLLYSATYTDAKDRAFGLSVGADRYLEKPLEAEDLLRELDSAVDERRQGTRPRPAAGLEEHTYLREYNERLVRKLEDKMLALERSYRELAESERRYHELFDVASDVIFTLHPDGTISLVNRRVVETLGHHKAELTGQPFEPLIAPSHRARARESIQHALSGQRRSLDLDFLTADGRIVPMHVVTVPLWQGERPTGLMGIARDMSERTQMEAARLEHARAGAGAARERMVEAEGTLARVAADIDELVALPGTEGDAVLKARLAACAEEVAGLRRSLEAGSGGNRS